MKSGGGKLIFILKVSGYVDVLVFVIRVLRKL